MMQTVSSPDAPPSYRVSSARSSCLSVQLENAPQQARETFTLSSAKSFYISPEEESKISGSSDHNTEPPLSVHEDSGISHQDSQEFPLHHCLIRLRPSRISPLANSNLEPSPLTDSTPQVMEREYDRDTWRMYKRIQSARTSSSSRSVPERIRGTLSAIPQSDRDDSCSSYSEDPFAVIGADYDESDTMFELDLE
jgi:hypothetical protein